MELILVNTPPKYGDTWWTNNIIHMLEGNLNIDKVHIINDIEFGGVYDKLRIFEMCKDQNTQYLYCDLDVLIKGNVRHLLRKEFTLLHAWWRKPAHTPLNSSIMSWSGDCSHIFHKFNDELDYNMVKYYKGIDQFIYEKIEYNTYDKVCDTYKWNNKTDLYPITLYNDSLEEFKKCKECLPFV